MPVPFPHRYSASLSRTFASRARMEAPLDGDVDTWSPEHMLLSSLGLCMLTTFEALAARDGIEVLSWDAKIHGTVEQTPEGRMFTSIVLELDMRLDGNVARVEATLEDAKQYCLVLNSLRVPVVIEAELHPLNEASGELPPLPSIVRPRAMSAA
jgi:organic hydroperoxide reductase OsmC/OhrA